MASCLLSIRPPRPPTQNLWNTIPIATTYWIPRFFHVLRRITQVQSELVNEYVIFWPCIRLIYAIRVACVLPHECYQCKSHYSCRILKSNFKKCIAYAWHTGIHFKQRITTNYIKMFLSCLYVCHVLSVKGTTRGFIPRGGGELMHSGFWKLGFGWGHEVRSANLKALGLVWASVAGLTNYSDW